MEDSKNDNINLNLKAFFQILWQEKVFFSAIIILFAAISLYYGFTLKEEFVSEGKILPEVQTKTGKLGGLVGLANLAGVEIGANPENTEAYRPDLYPDILQSPPFFLDLFKQKVITRNNNEILFEVFYHKVIEDNSEIPEKYNKKFPVKEDGFLIINRLNEKRIDDLKNRILSNIDKKSGIITISVKMPDPVVAASIARFSMIYLTNYITLYRTQKSKKNLDFLREKVDVAKGKFYSTQTKKAQYSDRFQLPTIRLQSADIERERIESEYRMSSAFYDELAKKYEEANINYQQSIPVFQVLTPPIAPNQKSEPRKVIILIIGFVIGGFIATTTILLKKQNYKKVFEIY